MSFEFQLPQKQVFRYQLHFENSEVSLFEESFSSFFQFISLAFEAFSIFQFQLVIQSLEVIIKMIAFLKFSTEIFAYFPLTTSIIPPCAEFPGEWDFFS